MALSRQRLSAVRRRAGGSLPVTPDEELWACALAIERQHGLRAAAHVAARIGALTLEGDVAGIRRWRDIAARLDELRGTSDRVAN